MTNPQKTEHTIEIVEPEFPALMFLVRHGHPVAILCGLMIFLSGAWLVREGLIAMIGLFASAVAGMIVYLLARVLWDIARLLAETMIPK